MSTGVAFAGAEIGDPPTLFPGDPCAGLAELEPCGEPIVIGAADHFNGPVEIVAFTSGTQLCISIDREQSSATTCGRLLPEKGAVTVNGYEGSSSPKLKYTQIVGSLGPRVARVGLRYKRQGSWRRAETLVAQVNGELLERLDEPEPFGVLMATLHGCKDGMQRFRLRAYDVDGKPLNGRRSRRTPRLCRRGQSGTQGIGIVSPSVELGRNVSAIARTPLVTLAVADQH